MTPAFLALSSAVLAFFVSGGLFLPTVPRFTRGPLGGDDAAVGIVIAAFAVSSLLMRPFAGRFADRRGRRIVLLVGAAITVVASLGHLGATTIEILIAMRLLLGVGEALFFVAAIAAATDLAPDERRGEAISLISLSLYLGIAIGPVVGELILGASGFGAVWIAAGGLALLSVVLSWFAPETLPPHLRQTRERQGSLLHRRGVEPGLLALCGVFGMGPFFAFLPLLTDDLGLGGSGAYLAAFAIVVVVLRVLGARLPDRLGAPRLAGTAFVISAIGLGIIALSVAAVLPVGPGIMAGSIVFAGGVAFTFPAIMAMAVIGVAPDERGSVVGTAGLFVDAAFGISPATLGFVAGVTGYPSTFAISAAFAIVGAAWLLRRRPGQHRLPPPAPPVA